MEQSKNNPQIYLGGSFDPVHIGHLFIAQRIHDKLSELNIAADIHFLPTAGSPLKNTQTRTADRIAMLELALAETPFHLDLRETRKTPPVYSIDTLKDIRAAGKSHTPIIFVMGLDSLKSLPKWKNGMALLDYCHFWVFDRTQDDPQTLKATLKETSKKTPETEKQTKTGEKTYHLSENLAQYAPNELQSAVTDHLHQLVNYSAGYIFFDDVRPPSVSSSEIRCHITVAKKLVSSAVWEYIKTNQLYRTP